MTVRDNIYLNGAKSWSHESNPHMISDFHAELTIKEEDGHYWLYSNLGDLPGNLLADRITTAILGRAFESEQSYENRDGSPISVDSDFTDRPRGEKAAIGPFESFCNKILLL